MDTNQNEDLARHQAFFSSVIRATTWSIAAIVLLLVLMAIFLL